MTAVPTSFAAQSETCARLLVGLVGGRDDQMAAINLCRRFAGSVLLRHGDVIVIEVTGGEELENELRCRLRAGTITHLCRSSEIAGLDLARNRRAWSMNAHGVSLPGSDRRLAAPPRRVRPEDPQ